MMKLLPFLAALLVSAEPSAASNLPSGRAFLPPGADGAFDNNSLSCSKHRDVRSSVLDIPRGGVGPLPVEDTAKFASAFCKFFDDGHVPLHIRISLYALEIIVELAFVLFFVNQHISIL